MEEFTPESLREYLRRPRSPDFEEKNRPAPENPAQARTARAQRIGEILRNAGAMSPQRQSGQSLDALVRQNLAELVRSMMEQQHFAELESMLENHARFIADIQRLLSERLPQ
ncbi:MAG: hypothetical protein K1X75_03470 [Leptospirales bacterium]|nr:hypothetical protein [Leptospirales bacterium]